MIVYMNVCDQCGNQNQIQSGSFDSGIDVNFTIISVFQVVENRNKYSTDKQITGTFCDRDCLIEWLKARVSDKGIVSAEKHAGEDYVLF